MRVNYLIIETDNIEQLRDFYVSKFAWPVIRNDNSSLLLKINNIHKLILVKGRKNKLPNKFMTCTVDNLEVFKNVLKLRNCNMIDYNSYIVVFDPDNNIWLITER